MSSTSRPMKMKAYASFDAYLDDQSAKNQEIIRALREFVKRVEPGLSEAVKWGNGCWVGKSGPVAYVYSDTGYVQFGFFNGAALSDPTKLLEGKGRYVRHIKVRDRSEIDAQAFAALLEQAAGSRSGQARERDANAGESRKGRMTAGVPANIDEYIAASPVAVRPILSEIRRVVRAAAPEATELISYRMPAFKQNGILIYFAAFKNHIGVFPPVSGDAKLETALARYAGPKGNLKFPLDRPIPYALIKRIVLLRMKQNLSKMTKGQTTRRKARKTATPTRKQRTARARRR